MLKNRLIIALLCLAALAGAAPRVLTADEAVELALAVDRRLDEARATLDYAEAARLAAWGSYLPLVGVTGGYSRNWSGPSTMIFNDPLSGGEIDFRMPEEVDNRLSLGAQASLYLYRGGENYEGITAARSSVRSAELQLESMTSRVAFETRAAWVELYRAQAGLNSVQRSLDSAREQLRLSEAMEKLGSLSPSEALKARSAVDNAELAVIQAENALASARANLAFLCGLPLDGELVVVDPEVEPLTTELDEALELARGSSPELRAAGLLIEETEAHHRAALSGYLPQLYLQGSYNWQEETPLPADALDENYNFTVGAYLSWSLFDGFAGEARRAQTNLSRLQARLGERDTDRRLELNLRLALNDLEAARRSVEAARATHERAVEDLELAQRKLELGSGTVLAALEAEANLSGAERALTDARAGYALACYQLELLIGEGSGIE